jgi:hypothetical protein
VLERLFDGVSQRHAIDVTYGSQQSAVGEVLHSPVWTTARHCVRVQLLCDVGLNRVQAQPGRRDAGERQHVFGYSHFGLTKDRIAESNIDAEGLALRLPGEPALSTESHAVVLRPIVHNLRCRLLMKRRHQSVPAQGGWLRRVVQGYFKYQAVPTNVRRKGVFRTRVIRAWLHALRGRSQRHEMAWREGIMETCVRLAQQPRW